MQEDIIIDKLCDRVYIERKIFSGLLDELIMYAFSTLFYATWYTFWAFFMR